MAMRGALHLHSEYSYDAKLTLAELKTLLKREGLSFALMTEHTDAMPRDRAEAFIRSCRELSDGEFVFVPGFEVPYGNAHVLMVGADAFFEGGEEEEVLRKFAGKAALSILAHPHRHSHRVDTTLREVINGVEIWNSQYDGPHAPRRRSIELLGELQAQKTCHAFGSWDLHRPEHVGGPSLALSISELSERAILAALSNWEFEIEGRRAVVRADGTYARGGGWRERTLGAFSIFAIAAGKWVNRNLAALGMRPPARLRQAVRRWL